MPISQINPDGSVKIFNKKTGQVLDVRPEELPRYNPALVGEYQMKLQEQQEQQAAVDLVKQGVSSVSDLATSDPIAAQQAIKQGVTVPKSKDAQAQEGVLGIIEEFKRLYNQPTATGKRPDTVRQEDLSFGREGQLSLIPKLAVNTRIAFNQAPDAKTYGRLKKGFTASLKEITGDTGILTDQDRKFIMEALPDFGDSDESARKNWESIDRFLQAKFGTTSATSYLEQPEKPTQQPDLSTPSQQQPQQPPRAGGNRIIDSVLNAVSATPMGAGVKFGAESGIYDIVANLIAPKTTDVVKNAPNRIAQKQATRTRTKGDISQALSNAAADTADLAGEVFSTAPEMALIAGSGAIAKGAGKILRPFKTVGEYRKAKIAEAAGKTISGDKLVSALEKASGKMSPTQKQAFDKFLELARNMYKSKSIGVDDAVQLNTEANKAYTAAGKVGKSAQAAFNKVLGDAIKVEMKDVAPGVAKANKLFNLLYGAKSGAKRLAVPAASTAVAGYFLNKILGQNRQ